MTHDPRTSHQQAFAQFPPPPVPPVVHSSPIHPIAAHSLHPHTPPRSQYGSSPHSCRDQQLEYYDRAPPPPYEAFPSPRSRVTEHHYASSPQTHNQRPPQRQPPTPTQAHRSRGNEYLLGLNTSVSILDINGSSIVESSPAALASPSNSPNYNKRLPPLPLLPPPLSSSHAQISSHRSDSPPNLATRGPRSKSEAGPSNQYLFAPPIPPRPVSQSSSSVRSSSPLKSFKPSIHPHSRPRLSEEDYLQPPLPRTLIKPHSDPYLPSSNKRESKSRSSAQSRQGGKNAKVKAKIPRNNEGAAWTPVIDLTLDASDSGSEAVSGPESDPPSGQLTVTPLSHARRKRASSEQPPRPPPLALSPSPKRPGTANTPGKAVQCAGFTRTGQPCKRLVKMSAPYLAQRDPNCLSNGDEGEDGDVGTERVMGRYCKDHAGMICQVGGFYWRGRGDKAGVWINFDDYIPSHLGQQTQTLLRMTMESKLTAKESPGFLYAYELKDLETPMLSFFKVGRTDNVPRRIGQWTNQCQSKTPTLRDIFPLPPSSSMTITPTALKSHTRYLSNSNQLHRSGTLTSSYLPGATTHLTSPCLAMKRWERLIHLELSDRSVSSSPECARAFDKVREKCEDCGMGHREIFPLVKSPAQSGGRQGDVYELVVEVICRWEKFVSQITSKSNGR
ncbi:hypothetical protein IAR55_001156 [Kwoniella newhampshirensis]|uniref:Bacteriophage T5 Orf172 DNA-binding domain-containing protein n=1 Tax=Kwoniella newhampshirensis TaxID=1651941 RepID=A0AAW0Z4S8_9TREE